MKKLILLTFLGGFIITSGLTKNLSLSDSTGAIPDNTVITIMGSPGINPLICHIFVTNNSTSAINVKVKKVENYLVENSVNTFCWGVCYDPSVYVSPNPITIEAGATDSTDFTGDYFPDNNPGLSSISYVFFDSKDPSDSVMVIVNYNVTNFATSFSLSYDGGNIPDNSVITFEGEPGDEMIESQVYITNNSASAKEVKVRKIENYLVEGSVNTFCWGYCYDPSVYVSTVSVSIDAGATNITDFIGKYEPNENPGISSISYVFFDCNNPQDYITVIVNYDATSTGIADNLFNNVYFSNAYPNPANNFTSIDYDLPYTVEKLSINIYNLLGAVIKEIPVPDFKGSIKINTNDLNDGIYFCTFIINGEIFKTNKLVIKH